MPYDLGHGTEFFNAYVVPDVSTFYQLPPGSKTKQTPTFHGFAGKFINMSPFSMDLVWDSGTKNTALIGHAPPFSSVGTATFPGHKFYFTPHSGEEHGLIKHRFDVIVGESIYVHDPYLERPDDVNFLSFEEFDKYTTLKRTLQFTQTYRSFAGREWLSRFPRDPPKHYMWEANHFGQEHTVVTKETHFTSVPPAEMLKKKDQFGFTSEQIQQIQSYRSPEPSLNLTLKTLSCAPRVFEIQNFLSPTEINHVLHLATGLELAISTVSGGDARQESKQTRTSTNSWVSREHSIIVDSIYRRAANVLNIDEALMRHRKPDEFPDYPSKLHPKRQSIAEPLQLVHYDVGQQYTAHHDFGYSPTDSPYQGARFATLLLYLNEGMEGGETSFPRAVNAETKEPLKVVPEAGKAVLFYSFLPDGNLDDFSQHSAVPVIKGEKWLMNLWVWDPVYEG